MRTQDKLLPWRLERQMKPRSRHTRAETKWAEPTTGTCIPVGNLELSLTNRWRLSVDNSELKSPRGSSHRRTWQFCEIYLQELTQILTVNTEEKSLYASSRKREKVTIWDTPEHSILLNKICPPEKLVNQRLAWGVLSQTNWPGKKAISNSSILPHETR